MKRRKKSGQNLVVSPLEALSFDEYVRKECNNNLTDEHIEKEKKKLTNGQN